MAIFHLLNLSTKIMGWQTTRDLDLRKDYDLNLIGYRGRKR